TMMLGRIDGFRAVLLLAGSVLLVVLALLSRGTGQGPVDRQGRPSGELGEKTRRVIVRVKRKERGIQMHPARRPTFLQAAADFRALNSGPPEFSWQQFREGILADSDDERHCREVIAFIRAIVDQKGCPAGEQTLERLEAELAEHLRRGTLHLPEVTPL